MRRYLDGLYRLSGLIAAALLGAIALIVIVQVAFNTIDRTIGMLGGRPPGFVIPSYADVAGFMVAATTFFALTYTFRGGAHIRVTLLLQILNERQRQIFALWSVFLAGLLAAYGTFYAAELAWDSFRFNDVSPGIIGIPLWLPQMGLFLGLLIFSIALVDEYLQIAKGHVPSFEAAEKREAAKFDARGLGDE